MSGEYDNPFLYPEAIDKGRDAAILRRVYEENKARGLGQDALSEIGIEGLKGAIDSAASERNASPIFFEDQLRGLIGPENEALPEFMRMFEEYSNLFDRVNVAIPSPENFDDAGVDFPDLAKEWEQMRIRGENPQLVIAPTFGTPAPWVNLYGSLESAGILTGSGGLLRRSNQGLLIDERILDRWENVDTQDSDWMDGIVTVQEPAARNGIATWQLCLVSGTTQPDGLGETYNQNAAPSVAAYLSLQAALAQSQQPLVDYNYSTRERSFSWLQGTFIDHQYGEELAIIGSYDGRPGYVNLLSSDPRTPVREIGTRKYVERTK